MVGRIETGRSFHRYINPGRPMPAEAEAVHGLGDAFLAEQPMFSAIVGELMDFIGDAQLVAHNAEFDRRFLNWELRNVGRDQIPQERVIDTLVISRKTFPGAKHTLDALCNRFGIDLSGRDKHGALLDAQLLANVYIELTGGRQIGLELASDLVEIDTGTHIEQDRKIWPARPHAASAEEMARHAMFLEKLKNPIWSALMRG